VELRQLRQFVVLARTLNFRRAAEQLNIAQPPLSVSIAKLEAELDAKLFERHQRGVRLTSAGDAALPFAQEAIARADEMRDAVGAVVSGKHGQLRIGFVSSASYNLAPRLTAAFRKAYPEVELILEEARGIECIQRVEVNALDLGIVRTPLAETTSLLLTSLEKTDLMVAVPVDHRLANESVVKLESLANEPFILYDRTVPGMRSLILLSCQNAGFIPKVAHTAAQIHTVLSLVKVGLGIALAPGIPDVQQQVHFIPVTCRGKRIPVGLSLVRRRRETSRLISNFWDMAVRVVREAEAS
jgi:DNA-binding transcriptional LysR family regulator